MRRGFCWRIESSSTTASSLIKTRRCYSFSAKIPAVPVQFFPRRSARDVIPSVRSGSCVVARHRFFSAVPTALRDAVATSSGGTVSGTNPCPLPHEDISHSCFPTDLPLSNPKLSTPATSRSSSHEGGGPSVLLAEPPPAVPSSLLVGTGFETAVGNWLLVTGGFLFGMIIIGGYTRLSGSGLSMTNWKFEGQIPPTSLSAWEVEYARYRETPEYLQLHKASMDLEDFKRIYFVEWFHRMWGRATGLFFVLPLPYFLWQRALTVKLGLQLGSLLGFGVGQAFLGWWMVRSGFVSSDVHMPLSNNKAPRVSVGTSLLRG